MDIILLYPSIPSIAIAYEPNRQYRIINSDINVLCSTRSQYLIWAKPKMYNVLVWIRCYQSLLLENFHFQICS